MLNIHKKSHLELKIECVCRNFVYSCEFVLKSEVEGSKRASRKGNFADFLPIYLKKKLVLSSEMNNLRIKHISCKSHMSNRGLVEGKG